MKRRPNLDRMLKAVAAMKRMRRATMGQLCDALQCKVNAAADYMHAMARAGLVRLVGLALTGKCGRQPYLWEWQG